ncbi:hypothetical protein AAII07_55310 [Microvirga sp. 0TCS3.31]
MGGHREQGIDGLPGLGSLVGAEVEIYWHSVKHLWSVRARGCVVAHVAFATLGRCQFVVRETERVRALERGQRSVHAWVRGCLLDLTVDNTLGMVCVGYSWRHAPAFTVRPGYAPICSARLVTFHADGHAYALP